MKIDFHIHTIYSGDSIIKSEHIKFKFQEKVIDGAVILDHNSLRGGLEFREILEFPVIAGEEIYTSAGEIIGLFLEKEIPPKLSLRETIFQIKNQGGLVYIPHPFTLLTPSQLDFKSLCDIISDIDIIEVYNAKHGFWGGYERALKFSEEHNLLKGAGSDAHHHSEIGKSYVEVEFSDKKLTPGNLKEILKKSRIFGNTTNPLKTACLFLQRKLVGGV